MIPRPCWISWLNVPSTSILLLSTPHPWIICNYLLQSFWLLHSLPLNNVGVRGTDPSCHQKSVYNCWLSKNLTTVGPSQLWIHNCGLKILFSVCGWLTPWMKNPWIQRADCVYWKTCTLDLCSSNLCHSRINCTSVRPGHSTIVETVQFAYYSTSRTPHNRSSIS